MTGSTTVDLLRELAPQVLGVLVRRHGQFDACEDAVQEASLAASTQWNSTQGADGVPDNPRAWLLTVATRRLTDEWRSESARRRRELATAAYDPTFGPDQAVPGVDELEPAVDDSLTLLLMCCHPALSPPSQLALSLRAVGGLTTAEVAAAFLVPESTMAQRISRAKKTIRTAAGGFTLPAGPERLERLGVVLQVLYLVFNEGYTASSGEDLQRPELAAEAIRLTRTVARALPTDGEVAGLLALMLLTQSRAAARTDADGGLVPLAEQDRAAWDRTLITEGVELVSRALATSPLGPYQLQAAIAAVHAEAPCDAATDWAQIAILYGLLDGIAPNPVVTLNRAVAVAKADGPAAGLALLAPLAADERVAGHHRLPAVRAHLLELAGDREAALADYREAARRTTSIPERRYLEARAHGIAAKPL